MAKYKLTSRNKARRRAIETIFEATIKGFDTDSDQLHQLIEDRCRVSTRETTLPPYAVQILTGVADHIYEIDMTLGQYCRGWSLDRLAVTDLAILRCAVWEMKYNPDVDWKISIDEAVMIGRDISTNESPRFLNGILDSIRKEESELL